MKANNGTISSAKVYVDVDVHFCKDGRLIPKAIIWEDGRRYEIDKVTQVAKRASMKAGGCGIRYTCIRDSKAICFTKLINGLWREKQPECVFHRGGKPWKLCTACVKTSGAIPKLCMSGGIFKEFVRSRSLPS